MKKGLLLIITAFSSCVYAAGEIRAFVAGAGTAFAVIRETDGDVWYVSGQVFEVWGTGARTAADYDIALTDKSGDMFVGDFDTNISAGNYHIVTHQQAGVSPADTDPAVWTEYGYWDGDEWFTGITQDVNDLTLDVDDVNDAVWNARTTDFDTAGTFGALAQDANENITLILADTNELQTDWTNGGRLDLLIDGIKAMTDLISIDTTTVASVDANDPNLIFTLTAGEDANDAYWMHAVMVEDATNGHAEVRWVYEWLDTRELTVDEPFSFDVEVGDNVWILGITYGGYLYDTWYRTGQVQTPVHYFDNAGILNLTGP